MTTPITDPFKFDELLTPAQRALRDQVREYMERVVRPAINDYWERGRDRAGSGAGSARPADRRWDPAGLWLRRT